MIKVILFDLDGTLLPMDDKKFTEDYFKRIIEKISPQGYEPEQLLNGICKGIKSMIKNNGEKLNKHVFWEELSMAIGNNILNHRHLFESFHSNEFEHLSTSCGYSTKSKIIVDKVKSLGYRVALATNPIFPSVATEKRIKWAGLSPQDFELCTTYENSSYCKPNIKYYEDILIKMKCEANECLMVGNNVSDDMVASTLGMRVFLLTDYLINEDKKDISIYPNGSYNELIKYIDNLNK